LNSIGPTYKEQVAYGLTWTSAHCSQDLTPH